MKTLFCNLLVLAATLLFAASASAQHQQQTGCLWCASSDPFAICEIVDTPFYPGHFATQGWTWCSDDWTDCHDGTAGPCHSHCHISSTACNCIAGDIACDNWTECADRNFNGVCDNEEGPICQQGAGCDDRYSPLVINLGRGTYRFSGAEDPVSFDINGDGRPDRITWTARGSEVALLCVDRNGDGRIDSGYELFGDYGVSRVKGDPNGWNGFEWLKLSDSNGNGVIDEWDAIWPRLRLWIDRNHDGISQPDELETLDAASVTMLGLTYHPTHKQDPNGNELRYRSMVWINGRVEPYYDVYFHSVQ